MLLSKDDILSKVRIDGAEEKQYRNASYDVTVGSIITPTGELTDTYLLPPQGIVRVVSAETISVPEEITGFATVKTSLCDQGVLALNIGVIDPCYSGPVSSALINFGKQPQVIKSTDTFLRLIFFKYHPAAKVTHPEPVGREAYVRKNRQQVLQHFSKTFLDIGNTTEEIAKRAFEKYKTGLFVYVPVAAVLLALLTFFLNFGILSVLQKFVQPTDTAKVALLQQAIEKQSKQIDQLEQQNRNLSQQVDALKAINPSLKGRGRIP